MADTAISHKGSEPLTICQARVKGDCSYDFNGTTFWTTEQCNNPSSVKFTIDDGEGKMACCKSCKLNFLRRKQEKAEWLGWFDDETPPLAPVKGSRLYYDTLFEMYKEEHPKAQKAYTSVKQIEDWLISVSQEEDTSTNLEEEDQNVKEVQQKLGSLVLVN